MPLTKRLSAEFIGTLWLVLGGCGSAVLATAYPTLGIQFFGVALAFGLTVLTGAYALGHISGAHFNPAVSIGLWAGKRFPTNELLPYIIAQVLGALAGAGIIYLIASGKTGFSVAGGFAANGFGDTPGSPGGYTALAAFIAEVVMTFFFLIVILGSTHKLAPKGFAPLAIGLCLTLIHLVTIPVTNTSVNPARSTGPAVFVALMGGSWAVEQLWLFWVAPILGALLAGFFYLWLCGDEDAPVAADTESEAVN
jgi:aquaporin Z